MQAVKLRTEDEQEKIKQLKLNAEAYVAQERRNLEDLKRGSAMRSEPGEPINMAPEAGSELPAGSDNLIKPRRRSGRGQPQTNYEFMWTVLFKQAYAIGNDAFVDLVHMRINDLPNARRDEKLLKVAKELRLNEEGRKACATVLDSPEAQRVLSKEGHKKAASIARVFLDVQLDDETIVKIAKWTSPQARDSDFD